MLSGRGLFDELISRPEESYRLWCVAVCKLETSELCGHGARVGPQRHKKKSRVFVQTVQTDSERVLNITQ